MNSFDLNAKISKRRNDIIIYIKEIASITDFLRIIGVSQWYLSLRNYKFKENLKMI